MKTLTKKIKVETKLAKIIQKHIDENKPLDERTRKNSRVMESMTVNFSNGIEADIKIVDTDTGPWIDAVLFDKGSKVLVLEPHYVFLGEYFFIYNDVKYVVKVSKK